MKNVPQPKDEILYSHASVVETTGTAASTFREQFFYFWDSMMGRYSFVSYLEIMNDFIDDEIRQTQAQGLRYTGGQVTLSSDATRKDCDITVELYFSQPGSDKYSVKRAARQLPKSKFIRRDIALLEQQQHISFTIEKPED